MASLDDKNWDDIRQKFAGALTRPATLGDLVGALESLTHSMKSIRDGAKRNERELLDLVAGLERRCAGLELRLGELQARITP